MKVYKEEAASSENFQILHYFGVTQQSAPSDLLVQEEPHSTLQLVEVAQSVERLATGWTFRRSNPGGGWDFPQLSRPVLDST